VRHNSKFLYVFSKKSYVSLLYLDIQFYDTFYDDMFYYYCIKVLHEVSLGSCSFQKESIHSSHSPQLSKLQSIGQRLSSVLKLHQNIASIRQLEIISVSMIINLTFLKFKVNSSVTKQCQRGIIMCYPVICS
jgi:hypothetical protein